MSRETDTPSSGPDGRGGAAYPSGTPPYGTPTAPGDGTDAGRAGARPEDRKTETTLTTRIRINIPGSRPIPPVVVRKPVAEAESAADTTAETPAPGPAASAGTAEAPAAAEPAPSAPTGEEKGTSDWFAPRKSAPAKGGPATGPANGTGRPGGSGAAGSGAAAAGPGAGASGTGAGAAGGPRPGAGRPGGVVGSMGAPGGSRPGGANGTGPVGGPRPGGANGAGLSGATGGPVAPGHGGGTGSFDVTEALTAGPLGNGPRPDRGGAEPRPDDLAYFPEDGQGGGPQGPAGPTTGPVTGDGPALPPVNGGPGNRTGQGTPGGYTGQGAPDGYRGPAGPGAPGGFDGPGAPGAGPGAAGHGPGGGMSDDTAILTPQKPAPEPDGPGYGVRHDNVSGDTVTSGIPVVPPGLDAPFGPGAPADGPLTHTPPKLPDPAPRPAAGSAKPPKKKGRNKLVLLGGGLVVLAGVAYGAGLLMNHSDVPKGTTVLGVEIGGGTRDEAVKKLNDAFDERVNKPLKLSVGGRTVTLEPDQAGLQFDMQSTVGAAAKSDYNPVSVIGSLFGNHRVVEPVIPVDEEKLHAALQDAAGGSGSVVEGTIKFQQGKAVAVYGKAGKGIDVDSSTEAVEEAYRNQVETGASTPVAVPTTTRQPTVPNSEVDRMMKEFAQPAMSGLVTIRTDAAHSIPFGPVSLPKILGVKAVDGKLVETYDLEALKEAYGSTFDDVRVETATGKRGVLPQDVVAALRTALRGKTAAERVGVIDTSPN
ncbi:hypothetical protein ACIF8T_19875 [Streptomyces sp. NPDC085946]|uniref:hypothetical protein n=1 Tax=Streptomyces sp. NPDC085946 TaxID=3365744 RepID=UPI0037D61674